MTATRSSSAPIPSTKTNAVNRDYAVPVWSALDASRSFLQVSNGFAGAPSDGLKQLDTSRRLTTTFGKASTGNLVQTARVDLGRDGAFSLVLGFGQSSSEAVATAQRSLHTGLSDYAREWHRYDAKLIKPRRPHGVSSHTWDSLLDQYYLSANYVKAAEDKTFRGAVAAALTSPWGQAISAGDKNNTYFGSYREVFARDLYEAWTALFLAGDHHTAKAMTRFLFERQQLPDGSMPRNSLTNGKTAPDSFNTQLDECAYPLVMALAVGLTGHGYYEDHIKPAANFVASHGPSFGPERWEEQGGFSPSTISAEIAGLVAAAIIADRNGDHASAQVWRGVADEFQRNLKAWTLTTNGPSSTQPYFIRLSKTGDPNAAINYGLGNGQGEFDQRSIIDAGFLEFARLGVLSEHDADLVHSLDVVDAMIKAIDGQRRRLLPLQPRRLRRPRERRAAVGAERPGQRPPVARAQRRARTVGARHRQHGRGGQAPAGDERDGLRRRPDPRAGVGAAEPGPVAVRHRPDHGVDRLHQRRGRRLGRGADMVGRPVRAADARRLGGPRARPPVLHPRPLRAAHAGRDAADRHGSRRQPPRR